MLVVACAPPAGNLASPPMAPATLGSPAASTGAAAGLRSSSTGWISTLSDAGPAPSPAPLRAAGGALLVADIGNLSPDEQLLFAALQGIVNRTSPRIYLLGFKDGQDYEVDPTARLWLNDAVPLPTQRVDDPYVLLRNFRPRGLVVWDPNLAVDTQNIATTIAGQYDLLPVSPTLAKRLASPPYALRVAFDLRRQHFKSRADAYEWALQKLGPVSRYRLLAWLGGPRNGRSGQHGLRDFIVARRGFAFEADPQSEGLLATHILDSIPAGTPVFGYPFFDDATYQYSAHNLAPGEEWGVAEISRSGKALIPSADSTNLTVHASFQAAPQSPRWDDHVQVADAAKTYVAFLISDGDNLGYNQQGLRTLHWDDPARFAPGAVPIGYSISPWLAVYAPRIYDFYVHGLRSSEVLVSGPSGAGYVYPQLHSDLDGYLTTSKDRLAFAGLRGVWILDNAYLASPSPVITQRYAKTLRPSVIFSDYGGYVVSNPPPVSFSDGVPVVHALWGDSVGNTVARVRASAAAYAGRPAFVLVALSTGTMSYAQARQVMDQLGPSFIAVRPDRFVGLIKGNSTPPAS